MFNYTALDIKTLSDSLDFNQEALEKVLRLSEILRIFQDDWELKNKYVLKGGTAINLCLFNVPRLSVDIDLDFNMECSKEMMHKVRKNHFSRIKSLMELEGYTITDKSKFTYALDSYVLKYVNMNQRPDNLKLEINYINRVHLLKPMVYKVNSNFIDIDGILSQSIIELYASKLSALIGRTTVRDLFDAFMMIENTVIKASQRELLKKCTVFYLMTSNRGQSVQDMVITFDNNVEYLTDYTLKRKLVPMLKKGNVLNIDSMRSVVKNFIHELLVLTDDESNYVKNFLKGSHIPELLFDDSTIVKRISIHPMVLWKMKHHKK